MVRAPDDMYPAFLDLLGSMAFSAVLAEKLRTGQAPATTVMDCIQVPDEEEARHDDDPEPD